MVRKKQEKKSKQYGDAIDEHASCSKPDLSDDLDSVSKRLLHI